MLCGLLQRIAIVITSAFWFGLTLSAHAQMTGSIQGTARDVSGAAVPNVSVTLTCDCRECGASPPCSSCCPLASAVTVHTDESGDFRFTSIPSGTYMITGEAPGFAKVTQTGIRVQPFSAQVVELEFQPGAVSETVSVTNVLIPTLIGLVVDDISGQPVADATITVSRRTCDCRHGCPTKGKPCDFCCPYRKETSTSTNEKGRFSIDLEPGDYSLRIEVGPVTKDQQKTISSKATQKITIRLAVPPSAGGAKH